MSTSKGKAKRLSQEIVDYLSKVRGIENLNINFQDLDFNEDEEQVLVYSPIALTSLQKTKAKKLVEKIIEMKGLKITFKINPDLLDGLKIEYKDKTWDLSLRGQIDNFSKELLSEN